MKCILVFVAACWRSSPPPPTPASDTKSAPIVIAAAPDAQPPRKTDLVLDRIEQFADELCRCSDAACARRVSADMQQWSNDFQNQLGTHFEDADEKRINAISQRMATCLSNAMRGSGTP